MALIVLALMLVATAGVLAYDSVHPVITFPDSNLELAVRRAIYEQLGKQTNDIRQSDLEQLTSLFDMGSSRGEIHNLYGLENCINLQQLFLYQNSIDDISPLSGLTELTTLILAGNEVTDISPLADLSGLT
ncbi:MAG: leucine-rich repeat domain-containing protein, partial [Dehalococcoidia bacterium]